GRRWNPGARPREAVQERPQGRCRDRPGGRAGRDLRVPRSQRRGQVDDRPDAHHASAADGGHRHGGRIRHRPRRSQGPWRHRRRAAGGGAGSAAHRPRAHAPADRAPGPAQGRAPRPRRRADRARRPQRGGRSQGRRLLRRDEAPAGPRPGARAPPADPLPGRADHGPGSSVALGSVGRGRPPGPRGRRHGVPHHAVPRGGRRAGRPHLDHQPRSPRRRGHAAGAQGRDRAAHAGGRPPRAGPHGRRGGRAGGLRRAGADVHPRGHGGAPRARGGRPDRRGPRARRGRRADPPLPAPRAHARRRLPGQDGRVDGPVRRRRDRGGARARARRGGGL
ncbi:MAG: Efflux ABC transporter, ATP-binding protein, partial [uncultured Solirubrobacteraceae bacterium]